MNIKHAIAHAIQKEQHSTDVLVKYGAQELTRTEKLSRLIEQIRNLYNRRAGRGYGQLDPDRFLTQRLAEESGVPSDFLAFSNHCVAELVAHLRQASLATGGYVIFVEYEYDGRDYLLITMLKSEPGYAFNLDLEIYDVEHLDLRRLHFAAQIDLAGWRGTEPRHVSFLKGRATDIAVYFKAFIGVDDVEDAREDTKELVGVVNDYCETAGLSAEAASEIKARVYGYCKQKVKTGGTILLEDLSHCIDEEQPERFVAYANERRLNDGIAVEPSALRALVKFAGQDRDVGVWFSERVWHTRVRYNAGRDELSISPVPTGLREQLQRQRQ